MAELQHYLRRLHLLKDMRAEAKHLVAWCELKAPKALTYGVSTQTRNDLSSLAALSAAFLSDIQAELDALP